MVFTPQAMVVDIFSYIGVKTGECGRSVWEASKLEETFTVLYGVILQSPSCLLLGNIVQ